MRQISLSHVRRLRDMQPQDSHAWKVLNLYLASLTLDRRLWREYQEKPCLKGRLPSARHYQTCPVHAPLRTEEARLGRLAAQILPHVNTTAVPLSDVWWQVVLWRYHLDHPFDRGNHVID